MGSLTGAVSSQRVTEEHEGLLITVGHRKVSGSWSQGYGCSPFKVVRELGSKRRETVWSLSTAGVR